MSSSSNSTCTFLQLNDDCLDLIFGLLELRDLLNASQVHQRFYSVVQTRHGNKYKSIDLNLFDTMGKNEIRAFFIVFGPIIESITGFFEYLDIVQYPKFSLGHIGHIFENWNFADCNKLWEDINLKPSLLPNLKKLKLMNFPLNDQNVYILSQIPNLESLGIFNNSYMKGLHLSKLRKLKQLTLFRCLELRPNNLLNILKCLKDLKSLDIRLCYRCNDDVNVYKEISRCAQLEELKISDLPKGYTNYIASLQKLTGIELWFPHATNNEFKNFVSEKSKLLERIAIWQSTLTEYAALRISELTNLTQLILIGINRISYENTKTLSILAHLESLGFPYCFRISVEGLFELCCKCKKVKKLIFEGLSDNVDELFLYHFIEHLNSEGDENKIERPMEKILVYVKKTKVQRSLLESSFYRSINSRLEVTFESFFKELGEFEMLYNWHL